MANPFNAFGTNAAYSGYTSVDAFNDVLSAFKGRGILSGWNIIPASGLVVVMAGTTLPRSVAIAENNVGGLTTINARRANRTSVQLGDAPTSGTSYRTIVLYVNNPPTETTATVDNPSAVGYVVVSSTSSDEPSDSTIRSAITSDGGTGSSAYYVIAGVVAVPAGTTTVTANMITQGARATLKNQTLPWLPATLVSSFTSTANLGAFTNNVGQIVNGISQTISEDGLYSISLQSATASTGTAKGGFNSRMMLNGTEIKFSYFESAANYAGNNFVHGDQYATIYLHAGDVLSSRLQGFGNIPNTNVEQTLTLTRSL